MTKVSKIPLAETTAEVLREGLRTGRWRESLPGQLKLAEELGVSRRVLRAALARLTKEGLISSAGLRQSPVILKVRAPAAKSGQLRVAILLLTPMKELDSESRENVLQVLVDLEEEGHHGRIVTFRQNKDPHKTGYLPKLVEEARADAWLVFEGTEEILRWFVENGPPVMALGGRSRRLPVAGVGMDLMPFIGEVLGKLIRLGHRRIVLISPEIWRHPTPTPVIGEFRRQLDAAGIRPGEYHTPEWDETPAGLARLLDELFRVTPPTAILCFARNTIHGVHAWLNKHALSIPKDVSTVTLWRDVANDWAAPEMGIARPSDDGDDMFYRRIRSWVKGVARGENDRTQTYTQMELIDAGSIGPAKV